MKTYHIESAEYKKGNLYDVSETGLPKKLVRLFFENANKYDHHPDFEKWTADKCIKSFKIEIKVTTI